MIRKSIETVTYKCEHCGLESSDMDAIVRHESDCVIGDLRKQHTGRYFVIFPYKGVRTLTCVTGFHGNVSELTHTVDIFADLIGANNVRYAFPIDRPKRFKTKTKDELEAYCDTEKVEY